MMEKMNEQMKALQVQLQESQQRTALAEAKAEQIRYEVEVTHQMRSEAQETHSPLFHFRLTIDLCSL